ncbi:hypothetical protein TR13x_03445 [Caloranaerobacter sp. TR13]|uniref:hypothetical protein n=1 Tax=Caloranaerobacter sp. TR13 TaxID=1302151 RepID=UPI0006D46B83|nr:hypothetical protein [Caloranaerobacter sp. TR13]KPU27600.1 hypothetical protein TR13x_03445 [Caloranaerobacter sp. TR13]
MKVLNHPIDMIAIFESDTGKITPFKFRYKDISVKVQKILKTYEEKIAGNRRIVFICMHNEKDIYEIKYEVDTFKWFLFKK